MRILILEPYLTGSHAAWAEGYRANSRHTVDILGLNGNFWKWRMHGGAVTLARLYLESGETPDLLLASDMLDLSTFLALTRGHTANIPAAVYFHENQLSYPWSPTDRDAHNQRDKHYGFINYATAMASNAVFFNSQYHLDTFFDELPRFLKHFPDHNELDSLSLLRKKSCALPLGLDLSKFDGIPAGAGVDDGPPILLWNHRWEYDKNPEEFFKLLESLALRDVPFRVAVLGENFKQVPDVFLAAREVLGERVVQFGYADDFETYAGWLHAADILPVTSFQDFFGASTVEAIYCGCRPLLPHRLAYPELIPARYHDDVFYDDFDDLAARLESLLSGDSRETIEGLRAAVSRYDWSAVAPLYDDVLEGVALNPGEGGVT